MPMVLAVLSARCALIGSGEHFELGKMVRPAKRRRALLESNPLRNTRRELIAWPDGKFPRTLRPAVFREPRNRFPDALKNSWVGWSVWGGLAKAPPQPPHHCLRQRAEGNPDRGAQIIQAVAQPVSPPGPRRRRPPPQHLYSRRFYTRRWQAALRPTTPAAMLGPRFWAARSTPGRRTAGPREGVVAGQRRTMRRIR
jgi:hypothetical protein